MSDKGTTAQLKTHIQSILNNSVGDKFISPQKHANLLLDIIDTLSPTYGTVSGTNTYTVDMNVTQVNYSVHKTYLLSFTNSNTSICTLNVDSLGSKPLRKEENLPLSASDIIVGKIYEVIYDTTTDTFRINI